MAVAAPVTVGPSPPGASRASLVSNGASGFTSTEEQLHTGGHYWHLKRLHSLCMWVLTSYSNGSLHHWAFLRLLLCAVLKIYIYISKLIIIAMCLVMSAESSRCPTSCLNAVPPVRLRSRLVLSSALTFARWRHTLTWWLLCKSHVFLLKDSRIVRLGWRDLIACRAHHVSASSYLWAAASSQRTLSQSRSRSRERARAPFGATVACMYAGDADEEKRVVSASCISQGQRNRHV